jgi:adenylosuccinate synthase
VYREFPGWQTRTDEASSWKDLPARCRAYLNEISN